MQISESEIVSQFTDFMILNNCQAYGSIILKADGQIHRYRTRDDKKAGQKTGAYCIWADYWPCGWVQNWRNGEAIPWHFDKNRIQDENLKKSLTDKQVQYMLDKSKLHQIEMQKQQQALQAEKSEQARVMFESLPYENDSLQPYLIRKGVISYGLKINKGTNTLAVPIKDAQGRFMSLQWINADGDKKYFPGAPKKGGFCPIAFDLLKHSDSKNLPIIIGEGYATMATVYKLTQFPCAAAMDCGNLRPVAEAIKAKYPDRKIIIAADNDHKTAGNPGRNTAKSVAMDLHLLCVLLPEFPDDDNGTDWNDYFLAHGEDDARQEIMRQIREKSMTPEEKREAEIMGKIENLMKDLNPNIQLPTQEFIGGMFPRKFLTALVAPSGTGKTMFLQKFCSDLSIGGSVFDGFAENEPVRMCLIFSGEAGFDLMIRRGKSTKWPINHKQVKVVDQYDFEIAGMPINLDDTEGWQNVCRIMDKYKPDIIFFDSLISFHESDENKASEMKPIFKRLNTLARAKNCAVVLVHHSRKRAAKERTLSLSQDDAIGSSVLNRFVGLIVGIEPMKEDEKTLLVRPLKTWFRTFMPFTYKISEDFYGNTVVETDLAPTVVNNSKIAVWNYLVDAFAKGEWFNTSQIILSEISKQITDWQLRRILADFVDKGKLQRRGMKKTLEYCIPDNNNGD